MDYFLWLRKQAYPIAEPDLVRDRPLEVLALGLPRSGTNSLHKALKQLGYEDCYHGMQIVANRQGDIPQWLRLTWAKQAQDTEFLNRGEFDRILGHCSAVTDFPCCNFGAELIRCYPEAKIVLNRRQDAEAWAHSVKGALFNLYPWDKWIKSFFNIPMFWLQTWWTYVCNPLLLQPIGSDNETMAERYADHYKSIKEVCRAEGREYLEWSVEDGWKPLCDFLKKEVPNDPFPSGNSTSDFHKFRQRVYEPRLKAAARNMTLTSIVLFGMCSLLIWTRYM